VLLSIFDYAYKAIDKGKVCIVVALDLRKAFPSVARDLLLEKLERAGIDSKWFAEYLSNRTQAVKDSYGNLSQICADIWGVPQGSVLGPLLFSIFINDLPNIPKFCKTLLFADDSTLMLSCFPSEIPDALKQIEYDIALINSWLHTNFLHLNADKTEMIVLGSQHNVNTIGTISITVNGHVVQSKQSVRILGFLIDSTLSCKQHISHMTRKCFGQLSPLFMLRPIINKDNMIVLIKAMVLSHLNYLPSVWGVASSANLKPVEKVIRCAARLVLNKKRSDSVSMIVNNELSWLGPNQLYYRAVLMTMYKIMLYEQSPLYFKELFRPNAEIHQHKTRGRDKLHITFNPSSEAGKKCITYVGATSWNDCKVDKNLQFVNFKKELSDYALTKIGRM
jgi:hypothetical protein